MIHQFIHFFVIWILSFQHLSSPVTCSFGQLWGCCLFLGYSLWYVVDQWHCVCLLPIYSTINSWILFLDYQWHMSGEFLGQFCASYRYKYACQGHLKLYAFKYKYTFQGYMHLYAHNCIWRHGSTALRDWLKKKGILFFFRFASSQPWIFKLIVWRAPVRLTLESQQWSDESDLASKHCQHFP